MKTVITSILLAAVCLPAWAQPVIQNGDNRPGIGWTSPFVVSAGATTPGGSGANQTWDYSSLSFNTWGTLTVIDYASSPYASHFAGANFVMELDAGGSMLYFYQNYSSMYMEELAIASSGPGNMDYTPNPPIRLVFPMSLGSSVNDNWQKVGGPMHSVSATYDAYGTFITPYSTYQNVVRIKNDYGGSEIDYNFFTTNPLRLLAVHRHLDNGLYLIDGASVGQQEHEKPEVLIFPNPVQESVNLHMANLPGGAVTFELFNVNGARVLAQDVLETTAQISRGNLPAGLYFYRLSGKEGLLSSGQLNLL